MGSYTILQHLFDNIVMADILYRQDSGIKTYERYYSNYAVTMRRQHMRVYCCNITEAVDVQRRHITEADTYNILQLCCGKRRADRSHSRFTFTRNVGKVTLEWREDITPPWVTLQLVMTREKHTLSPNRSIFFFKRKHGVFKGVINATCYSNVWNDCFLECWL